MTLSELSAARCDAHASIVADHRRRLAGREGTSEEVQRACALVCMALLLAWFLPLCPSSTCSACSPWSSSPSGGRWSAGRMARELVLKAFLAAAIGVTFYILIDLV